MKRMIIIPAVAGLWVSAAWSATYYVDATGGSDANAGTATDAAWQSLTNVNATTFQPGDEILFKSGEVWFGGLDLLGSGSDGSPITIDKYGTGPKPLINGDGITGRKTAVIRLRNVEYWEIRNLEITNDDDFSVDTGTDAERAALTNSTARYVMEAFGRTGILAMIDAEEPGANRIFNHIYIEHCDIHNVDGINNLNPEGKVGFTGGIIFQIYNTDYSTFAAHQAGFNDCRVAHNTLVDVDYTNILGVWNTTTRPRDIYGGGPSGKPAGVYSTGFYVGYNYSRNSGQGVIDMTYVDGMVVEHNTGTDWASTYTGPVVAIYPYWCRNSIFQYNEAANGPSTGHDGAAWDIDADCENVFYQYNYSHNNPAGWTLIFVSNRGVGMRYNVSQFDGDILGKHMQPGAKRPHILNNVFYYDAAHSSLKDSSKTLNTSITIANNVFYNVNPNITTKWSEAAMTGDGKSINMTHNAIYEASGNYSQLPTAFGTDWVIGDPMMVNPGSGGSGTTGGTAISSLDGYKLLADSPLINAGMTFAVEYQGTNDFFGTELGRYGELDIGFHEFQLPLLADAGPDRTVEDSDSFPGETVMLDGSASSDTSGTITNYVWAEGGITIATGLQPTISLDDGAHTITLTVYNDLGKSSVDTVVIYVAPAVDDAIAVLYSLFLTPAGSSSSASGSRTILGDTWNDIALSANEPVGNIAATPLKDIDGNVSPYSFAAIFNMQQNFLVGSADDHTVASDPSWDWYHNAVAVDASVAIGPRVDRDTWTATPIGTVFTVYTFSGFETNDLVTLDFVISRGGTSGLIRRTGVIADGTDLGVFGSSYPDVDEQFSVSLSGKTAYDLELYAASSGNSWAPIGNAFRLNITPYTSVDSDRDGLPDYWEIQMGLNPTNTADALIDTDGDGMINRDEYVAGTDPGNTNSVFKITESQPAGNQFLLSWSSASNRHYHILESTNLTDWVVVSSNIPAAPPENQIGLVSTNAAAVYFKMQVERP